MREKASSHKSSALPQGFFYYHSRSFAKLFHPPKRLRPRQARPPGSSACLGGMGGRAVAALCVFGSGSAHPTARRPCTVPSGSALLSPPQSHPRGSGRFCPAARLFPPSRREGMAAGQSRPLACAAPSCPPHPSVARHGSLRFGAVSPAAQPLAPRPCGFPLPVSVLSAACCCRYWDPRWYM